MTTIRTDRTGPNRKRRPAHAHAIVLAAPLLLVACYSSSPISEKSELALRRAVEQAAFREITEAERLGSARTLARDNSVSTLGIDATTMQELDLMAGPLAHAQKQPPLGPNLLGTPTRTVVMNLERAVKTAVANNIAVQFARLNPAIGESRVTAAEAAFDWTFFSNTAYNNIDSPRTRTSFGSTPTGPTSTTQTSLTNTGGLRRTLIGGGRLTVQQELGYNDDSSVGQTVTPDPSSQLAFQIQYDQPLLKGLGSDYTQSEIRLARNAERNNIQTLKRDLIRTVADTEKTYWELTQSRQDLLILQRLLERGEATLQQLVARQNIDANQAQIADARARVSRRRADLTRAQTQYKNVSDRLKVLMNDPTLPVGSETLVLPADQAIDAPVRFSLQDSIRQGVLNRPEIQQAILSIDDTSIRRIVADNARQPDLNLRLQTRLSALEDNFVDTYREVWDARYVDYVVSLAFEVPIGKRLA